MTLAMQVQLFTFSRFVNTLKQAKVVLDEDIWGWLQREAGHQSDDQQVAKKRGGKAKSAGAGSSASFIIFMAS